MRTIYLNFLPTHADTDVGDRIQDRDKYRAIAATPQAARTLGVPYFNLEILAEQICHRHGLTIAPLLLAHRTLQTAVKMAIDPTDLPGTVRVFTPAIRSILRAGLDLDALSSVAFPRVRQLAAVTSRYQQMLHDSHAIDPAELFWQATRLLLQGGEKNGDARQVILVYGYCTLRPDNLAFIDAIADHESAIVLPWGEGDSFQEQRSAIDELQQRGWVVFNADCVGSDGIHSLNLNLNLNLNLKANVKSTQKHHSNKTESLHNLPDSAQIVAHRYPNIEAEVRGTLAQVKLLLTSGISAREIVLVARDDAMYGATLLDMAWEYQIPIRALYSVPLAATRLGAWLRLLLDVIQSHFAFESTAKLLSHPIAGNRLRSQWAEARHRHPQSLAQWQTFGQELGLDLSSLNWKKKATRSDWVQLLQSVFKTFDVRKHCGRWAKETLAFYRLKEALVTLAQPERERLSLDEFVKELTDSLNLLTVAAQPGRGGVELHQPHAICGAKYRHVFVLGTAEGMFPAPDRDDPILDFFTRKQLNRQGFLLETAAQMTRREAVTFPILFPVAQQALTFSYPERMGKEEMLPSPYLLQLNCTIQRPDPVAIASLEEARKQYIARLSVEGNTPQSKTIQIQTIQTQTIQAMAKSIADPLFDRVVRAWVVEHQREQSPTFDRYDGAIGIPLDKTHHTFSASQLTQLGQCGFKWFANYLLKLAELDEMDNELTGRLQGRLYHKTLEMAVKAAREQSDLRQGILEHLEEAFTEAEKFENIRDLTAWQVRRQEHLDVLRRTIAHETFWTQGNRVVAIEQSFTGEWHGFKIKGTVDRIDETPAGLKLIEYKNISSKPTAAKDATGKANLEIQLPLYKQVATSQLFPDRPVAEAYYYSLTKQKIFKADVDEAAFVEFADRIDRQLQHGHYPVAPDVDGKACNYCCQDLVCRKGTRLDRKLE
jgi:ATP-dependent helicase/DNAse subunit B